MNSALNKVVVGPVNSAWIVRKQYGYCSYTLEKKKKEEAENANSKRGRANQTLTQYNPNEAYVYLIVTKASHKKVY